MSETFLQEKTRRINGSEEGRGCLLWKEKITEKSSRGRIEDEWGAGCKKVRVEKAT